MRPRTKPEPVVWLTSVPRERRSSASPGARLVALDVFRGIAIAAMILVNSPGGGGHRLAALQHATWNGCTIADLIFPAFLFIVGVAVWLSVGEAASRGERRGVLAAK